jgi:hypothetical protein
MSNPLPVRVFLTTATTLGNQLQFYTVVRSPVINVNLNVSHFAKLAFDSETTALWIGKIAVMKMIIFSGE